MKMKHTPDTIINIMNNMGLQKEVLNASDIELVEIEIVEEIPPEPSVQVHIPDPNTVEVIEDNRNLDNHEGQVDEIEEQEEAIDQQEDVESVVAEHEPAMMDSVEAEVVEPTRRSTRSTAGVTSKYDSFAMMTRGYGLACANLKVKVALERFGKDAYDAIKDELVQLFFKKRALVPIKLREVSRVNLYFPALRSHMFLREKYNAAGMFKKIKARLVADGSTQDREDFEDEDISSPTASIESIFNMLKLVAVEKRHLFILDVGGAYLSAKIDRPVYMYVQPDLVNILLNICPDYAKYKDQRGRILTIIDKAMYGLVKSAKLWYDTITGVLERDGYTPNPMDQCVWNKIVDGNQITIVIYVDDLAISCKCKEEEYRAMDLIKKEFTDIKIKDSNELTYLGMNLKITDHEIEVDMISYIQETLKEFEGIREYVHPADEKLFNAEENDQPSSDPKSFHRIVAKLYFFAREGGLILP